MDPITAVGFASSILTFIDFSWSLVRGSYEVYRSDLGITTGNAHVSNVIDDLLEVTEGMETDIKGQSQHEKALIKLAKQCKSLSRDLSKILQNLRMKKDTKWESLKTTWKSMRMEKEVISIEKRLGEYRGEIVVRLNLMLFASHSSIKDHINSLYKEGLRLSTESAKELEDIRNDLQGLLQHLKEDPGNSTHISGPANPETLNLLRALRESLVALNSKFTSLPKENAILRRLYYDSIYRREDSVEHAESGTFSWILEGNDASSTEQPIHIISGENENLVDDADNGSIRSSSNGSYVHPVESSAHINAEELEKRRHTSEYFISFLKKDNGVFFVSGKAGSGKSTLMKFLGHHPRVREELESWSGDKKLVLVTLFFWNSGDKLQMSLEGFYRSLLFETLRQCPELVETAFPGDWGSGQADDLVMSQYRLPELITAVRNLTRVTSFPKHRFCIFVDGLDEYEGDSLEHFNLARALKAWATSKDVKIVCAARPHIEFLDTFTNPLRTVQLHELTREDIRHYINQQLEKELIESESDEPLNEYRYLADSIVSMADGIFLWARLVTRSVLEGIKHDDSKKALRERVEQAPKDLNKLFAKMLNTVDDVARRRSDAILLVAAQNPLRKAFNALAYSWLDDLEDEDFPFNRPADAYTDEEVETRHRAVRRQLVLLTKGLLEMRENNNRSERQSLFFKYSVEFFHRSVGDYLKNEWKKNDSETMGSSLRQIGTCCRIKLAEWKFSGSRGSPYSVIEDMKREARDWPQPIPFRILDELRKVDETTSCRSTGSCKKNGEILGGEEFHSWSYDFHACFSPESRGYTLPWFSVGEMDATWHLSFASYFGQGAYVLQKLDGALDSLRDPQVVAVLLATLAEYPDANIARSILANTAMASALIHTHLVDGEGDAKTVPVWFMFLRWFTADAAYKSPKMAVHYQILEQFLTWGADRDVIIVAFDQNLRIEKCDEQWSPPETALFYIELHQLLQIVSPPPANINSLNKLLMGSTGSPFWRRTTKNLLSRLALWGAPSVSIRDRYRPVEIGELMAGNWVTWGVVSKEEEWFGSFRVRLF